MTVEPGVTSGVIELGNRRELFVDRHLIDHMAGVHHFMHRPTFAGKVLTLDQPCEGNVCGYSTLLHDGERYRLYYRGWHIPHPKSDNDVIPYYCVAYSDDGIHFTRPKLGLVPCNGSTDNNALLKGNDYHSFAPFVDTRPDTPADEKFKAIATTSGHKAHELLAMVSPDGLTWRTMQDKPVIGRTKAAFDSMNLAFWSPAENQYVCFGRQWSNPAPGETYGGKRTICRFTSSDFLHWQGPFPMTFSGTPLEEFYTSSTQPYPRAPHLLIALPKRFVKGASPLSQTQADELGIIPSQRSDTSDCCLLTSRGGNNYDRLFMEAFVPPGRDPGNWGARSHMSVWGMAQTAHDEISLYFNCHYGLPTAHIARYTLRTDGFASIRAPWQGGTFTTKPFTFQGRELSLNFATSAAGRIQVEIQNPQGHALIGHGLEDSRILTGDTLDGKAAWQDKTDLSALQGQPVRLHFAMRDADLYAMKFE